MTALSQASSPAARSSAVPQELFPTPAKKKINLVPLPTRQLDFFSVEKSKAPRL